jgi:hypothetical protein
MDLLGDEPDPRRRRSRAREYLQARILLALQDSGAFTSWAFVGGTALRFLYGIPRYSEDLDFSATALDADVRFADRMDSVNNDLKLETYRVEVQSRIGPAVASSMVTFRGLLHELGISAHEDEVLKVKVEIDCKPPAGARLETRLVRRFVMLNLLHHDRASLLAGKLHAVMTRQYTKGRDLYDLVWYLSDPGWPPPNLVQLDNALRQTGWDGPEVTADNWRSFVLRALERIDWKKARQDVAPFLERRRDVDLVSETTLVALLVGASRDGSGERGGSGPASKG